MTFDNGDIIYGTASPPYVGFTTGAGRSLRSPSDATQASATAVALSPDGSKAAFAHSSVIEIFDTTTWARTALSWSGTINDMEFSPDGSKLAVAHSTPAPYITIYDTATWTPISNGAITVASSAWSVAWSPDGSKLAVAHNSSPYLTIFNTADWSTMAAPGTPPTGNCVAVHYSPDGAKLAVASTTAPRIFIYNATTLASLSAPTVSSGNPNVVRFSPDSTKLAIGMAVSAFLRVFNVADWSLVSGAPTINTAVNDVVWTHANEAVIGNNSHPRLSIWNVTTGALEELSGVGGTVNMVAVKKYTPKTISGTVKDAGGNGIVRTVRAYRRDTGELVGETSSNGATGAYSIKCRYFGEHDVVMCDDAAGSLENDQILRTTPL